MSPGEAYVFLCLIDNPLVSHNAAQRVDIRRVSQLVDLVRCVLFDDFDAVLHVIEGEVGLEGLTADPNKHFPHLVANCEWISVRRCRMPLLLTLNSTSKPLAKTQ
jgi:hypothetical protein